MGYYITIRDSNFKIKKENFDAALAAIKSLAGKETIEDSGGRHFSWVNPEFVNSKTLENAIKSWRWEPLMDKETGDVDGLEFDGKKYGDEEVLFAALAPYVEPDSFIEVMGEEGEMWRWFFDGKKLITQEAKITWE